MLDHGGEEGRSPHGERGLKYNYNYSDNSTTKSLPSRGAWIEIAALGTAREGRIVAPLTGSVD